MTTLIFGAIGGAALCFFVNFYLHMNAELRCSARIRRDGQPLAGYEPENDPASAAAKDLQRCA